MLRVFQIEFFICGYLFGTKLVLMPPTLSRPFPTRFGSNNYSRTDVAPNQMSVAPPGWCDESLPTECELSKHKMSLAVCYSAGWIHLSRCQQIPFSSCTAPQRLTALITFQSTASTSPQLYISSFYLLLHDSACLITDNIYTVFPR